MLIDFNKIAPAAVTVPAGTYACLMHVDDAQRDRNGRIVMNGDGEPKLLTTKNGDLMWRLRLLVLEGEFDGQEIEDALFFSAKALRRVEMLLVRAKLIPSEADCNADPSLRPQRRWDVKPADLAGTLWWVTVSEVKQAVDTNGQPIVTRKGEPFVRSLVAFDGYEPMDPENEARYRELADAADSELPF
jgi:hypothetical protein